MGNICSIQTQSPWEQGRAGWPLLQPLKGNKYLPFAQLSSAQPGRREEGDKEGKDTDAHPGAVGGVVAGADPWDDALS